jgi:hypothetical protein
VCFRLDFLCSLCSEITEMLPSILNQLGADSLTHLKLSGVPSYVFVPCSLCSEITEMLPGILNQLGADSLTHLKRLASGVANASSHAVNMADGNLADNDDDDDDEVLRLVTNWKVCAKIMKTWYFLLV